MKEERLGGEGGPKTGDVASRLREVLDGEPDVSFAYLFGSVAKKRPRHNSDIDVAVFLAESVAADDRLSRALALEASLERVFRRSVQVVTLNDAPLELARNVLGHGAPVLTRDLAARRAFFVETAQRYYDMAPARATFDRYRARRIREGTFGG